MADIIAPLLNKTVSILQSTAFKSLFRTGAIRIFWPKQVEALKAQRIKTTDFFIDLRLGCANINVLRYFQALVGVITAPDELSDAVITPTTG